MANIFESPSKDENITPEKRVNCDKCSFATNTVCLGSSLSVRSFAIAEPRLQARALYASIHIITLDIAHGLLSTFIIVEHWKSLSRNKRRLLSALVSRPAASLLISFKLTCPPSPPPPNYPRLPPNSPPNHLIRPIPNYHWGDASIFISILGMAADTSANRIRHLNIADNIGGLWHWVSVS